jgi:hypothetical protein
MGPGFHGRKRKRRVGGQTEIASRSGTRWWERRLSGMVPEALPELGVFTETCPTKVLFIADGQPYSKVWGRGPRDEETQGRREHKPRAGTKGRPAHPHSP